MRYRDGWVRVRDRLRGSASTGFLRGVIQMVPVLLGTVPFGLVLGAQAANNGLDPVGIGLMCGLNFAGGSEFIAVEM